MADPAVDFEVPPYDLMEDQLLTIQARAKELGTTDLFVAVLSEDEVLVVPREKAARLTRIPPGIQTDLSESPPPCDLEGFSNIWVMIIVNHIPGTSKKGVALGVLSMRFDP